MWWRTPLMKPDIWHDPLFLAGLKGGGQGGSASGPIVTFTGDGSPLRSLRLAIDPVQDLHGYDSPWPAGGGKNLFNDEDLRAGGGYWWKYTEFTTRQSAIHLIKVSPNTAYTISKRSGALRVAIQQYGNEALSASENPLLADSGWKTATYTFTTTANTNYLWVTFSSPNYEYDITASDVQACDFQLELGSTATTYSPYSNVCPISGWDEANLWRTGINVWDEELEIGGINNNTGQNNDSATSNMRSAHYVSVIPGEKYRIVCGAGTGGNLYWYDREKNFIRHISWAAGTVYTVPSNAAFARFITSTTYGTTYNHDISINYPSTDISYHAYTGTTYPITIPTPPGTVYGGYISVGADGSAELVVDRAYESLNDPDKWITASSTTQDFEYTELFNDRKLFSTSFQGLMCSAFAVNISASVFMRWTSSTSKKIGIKNNTTEYTISDIQQMAQNNQIAIVYELATPLHYPLSDITVQTLAGENVMWADCGDVAVEGAGGKGFGKEAMLAWVMNR